MSGIQTHNYNVDIRQSISNHLLKKLDSALFIPYLRNQVPTLHVSAPW